MPRYNSRTFESKARIIIYSFGHEMSFMNGVLNINEKIEDNGYMVLEVTEETNCGTHVNTFSGFGLMWKFERYIKSEEE